MKKLFVGNLSYSVGDDELRELFAEHGNVIQANVVMDRATGRSRGFGFVEMDSDEQARAAIEALDGAENGGRKLTVNESRPREPRSDGGGRGGHRGGDRGQRGDYGDRN